MRTLIILIICTFLGGANAEAIAEKTNKKENGPEMLPWEEVNEVLPKYTKFMVQDLETGKKFKVQRRAGSRHADVQPLTVKDTKIMKEIYNGKWSWKRRAIIVVHHDKKIAASMHGMPHGAGALKNNFPGHFCIHFYRSTTHRRNYMDLSHQLMILKAAGKLEEHLATANPYEVINAYVAGLKERDSKIVSAVSLQDINWDNILPTVENIALTQMPLLPEEDLKNEVFLKVPVRMDWYLKGIGRKTFKGEITLIRLSTIDPWEVDSDSLLKDNGLR